MRTTVRLDDALLREAKVRAARAGRSLSDFIEQAVRAAVLREQAPSPAPVLPVFSGGELRPGVTLDSGADLLELMERDDAVR